MSRTLVYLLGYCTLILGLALAARLLGIPDPWLVAGVVILLGSGIMAASSRLK
jgi:positive regulator of sigma E activity